MVVAIVRLQMVITVGLSTARTGILGTVWAIKNNTTDAICAIHNTKGKVMINQDLEYTIQQR